MIATSSTLLASYASFGALSVCAQLLTQADGQSGWTMANSFGAGNLDAGVTRHSALAASKGQYFTERNAIACANDLPPKLFFRPGKRSQITYERRL
jgi:hypothetical protein